MARIPENSSNIGLWLKLIRADGVGPVGFGRILKRFGSVEATFTLATASTFSGMPPSSTPKKMLNMTATSPIDRETRVPAIKRDHWSRPSRSVPNR